MHTRILCRLLTAGVFALLCAASLQADALRKGDLESASRGDNDSRAALDEVSIQKLADQPEDLDIYLLMGQSNMVGMEKTFLEEDKTPHPRVFMLNANKVWVPAAEPLHAVGVGPGFAFGRAMANHDPQKRIGLVPLAVGSTPIRVWVKGATYYKLALAQAQVARQAGTIKGILWHQGESDSYDQALAAAYAAQVKGMITDLRQDLGEPHLPVVCGELGRFLEAQYAPTVRAVQLELPQQLPLVAAVPSEGLINMDPWHFDAASQRTFGQRYAEAMIELQERPNCAMSWRVYAERPL